jgi:hypothetical protein
MFCASLNNKREAQISYFLNDPRGKRMIIMGKAIDLNCDMGESFGIYKIGNDQEMMKHVTSISIMKIVLTLNDFYSI